MTRSEATAGAEIKPARFAVNERVRVLDELTGRPVDTRERGGRAHRGDRPHPHRVPERSREDRADVPRRTTASATPSPATTPRSTPTARSGSSAAARPASTPVVRRCTPRRSSSSCASTAASPTVSCSACPTSASASRWSRSSNRTTGCGSTGRRSTEPIARPISRPNSRSGAGRAWPGTSGRAGSSSSTPWRRSAAGQGRLPLPQGSREPDARHVGVRRRCRRIRCRQSRPRSGRARHAWRRTARSPRPRGAPRRRSAWSGIVATPALSVTEAGDAARHEGGPHPLGHPHGVATPNSPGSTTANSSPPSRAARSDAFVRRASASATVRSTASPAGWPPSSLTALKWSTSSIEQAHGPLGAGRARDLEGQRLLEQAPVREPGEVVAGGEQLDLVEQRAVAQRQAACTASCSSVRSVIVAMPGPAARPPFGGEHAVARTVGADRDHARR